MKILYVSIEIPQFPGGGGQIRQYNILKMLQARHEVHVICPTIKGELLENLKQVCNRVIMPGRHILGKVTPNWSHGFILKINKHKDLLMTVMSGQPWQVQSNDLYRKLMIPIIKRELESGLYDIIQLEHTDIAHWISDIRISIPKIVVAHNVKSILYKRYWENAKMFRRYFMQREHLCFLKYERTHLNNYNCVVVMSEIDGDFIKQLYGENIPVAVVHNGVDIDYFLPETKITECSAKLIFVGSMDYLPNNEAVLYFYDNIFPLILKKYPTVTFSIVGKNPSAKVLRLARHKNITVTGFLPDTRPNMTAASIVVVPLISGSGTRLKILEAMALGKAVVSTSIGAEGIEYTDGKDIIIADTDQNFAEKVLYLLSNNDVALKIGKNARRLVEKKYAWKIISDKMDHVYSFVIANARHQCLRS
jgi:glycosyltransferase involved in cell wall biosynthesis